MQSNLCTETFNYFDLDQAKIEQRANDEFEKITLTGGRPAERILYHCKIGQAAEVYFLDKCGYTDNPKDYQDIFNPESVNVDVKVTEKGDPTPGPTYDIQGCFDGVVDHIIGTVYPKDHPKAGQMKTPGLDKRRYEWNQEVADKIYFLHHNPTTRQYTFLCTASANKEARKYVQDAVDML